MLSLVLSVSLAAAPLIVIDPGHGGVHDGAVGVCGAKEKDVALAVSLELGRLLEASGRARAVLTRSSDAHVELHDRARIANAAGAALFVSVHANSGLRRESRGVETFFLSHKASDARLKQLALRENEGVAAERGRGGSELERILKSLLANGAHHESQRLAKRLQESLNGQLAVRGRGVLQAPFIVLAGAEMPAALVEIGFLSHPEECALLASTEYQRRIAKALGTAILAHVFSERLLATSAGP